MVTDSQIVVREQWNHPEEVRHASRNAGSACPFLYWRNGKKGMLSQHFVTHVVPPLKRVGCPRLLEMGGVLSLYQPTTTLQPKVCGVL